MNSDLSTDFIQTMALHFKEANEKDLEFSWTLKPGVIETKGRLSCWTEGKMPSDFKSITTALAELNAPDIVRNEQTCIKNPYRQGIGVSCVSGDKSYRLYLHSRTLDTQKDYYEAWRWGEDGTIELL